jgi:hypothetical protein
MTAAEFWSWFASEEAQLRAAGGQVVADRVEARLREVDPRIGIEVGEPADERELIFTSWSHAEVFPAVRALMSSAPQALAGWKLIALKPPRGFEFTIDVEGLQVDARRLWFDALSSPEAPGALGIRVYVGVGVARTDQRWAQALGLIVETGIGEDAAAQIDYIEPYGGPPADERSMPITELLKFVQWFRRQHPRQ